MSNQLAIDPDTPKIVAAGFVADEIGVGCLEPIGIRVGLALGSVKIRSFPWRENRPFTN